ncbi:MAG TPA: ubiquinone/menaquinone biosynthesis methyltransferase [Acidobacteriaceae bacterium]|nr:ubiquinone/menaquinone biosynthesis methyltransferase [Acidobacteriaceae bacterium]
MSDSAKGAEPVDEAAAILDEQSASHAVQSMFNSIAPRYDLLNHILSANIDRLWWWRAAREFRTVLRRPEATVLDMCCGTGDMTLALLKHRPANGRPVLALDFAHAMLLRGKRKLPSHKAIAIEADALQMPIAEATVDLITSAFGFRNLANYQAGLCEIRRVLRVGGEIGILDFSEPDGALSAVYRVYFSCILPRIGRVISGSSRPYEYLPRSVHRFPSPSQMLEMMTNCGFSNATWTPYTFGIAGLYRAVKT